MFRQHHGDGTRDEYHIGDENVVPDNANVWTSFVMFIHIDSTGTNSVTKVWKSEGSAVTGQCRGFTTNPQVDNTDSNSDTTDFEHSNVGPNAAVRSPRIYKGNWKIKPDGTDGPINILFDAFYVGPDTTTDFEDVNPCQLSVGSAVP
jgi:hypothetical protein